MKKHMPEAEGFDVVIRGSFNPGIFHPEWFRRQEILRPQETEDASINAITPDVADISFLDMHLQVLTDRFSLKTEDISRGPQMQDIATAVMQTLYHTPVKACGLNHWAHYRVQDENYWHRIGDALAPKEKIWKPLFPEPGMGSLTIKAPRRGDFPGEVNVTVQPSNRFFPGIFLTSNTHYPVAQTDAEAQLSDQALEFLKHEWNSAFDCVPKVAERIFTEIKPDERK